MRAILNNAYVWTKAHFSKSLACALFLSVLLHTYMVYELLQLKAANILPRTDAALFIDATLIKAVPKPKPQAKTTPTPKPVLNQNEPPVVKPDLMEAPPLLESEVINEATLPVISMSDADTDQTDAPPVIINNDVLNQMSESTGEENLIEPEVINPNAYEYVETHFDVRTDISATPQAGSVGDTRMIFQLTDNNTKYQIESIATPKGFASLFIANLNQKSVGNFTEQGLQPLQYDYQFGDKPDKTYRATFDWEREKLMMTTIKGTQIVNLTNGAQDLLSFMYQLMYVPPLNNLQFNITNGKKFALYSYLFEGEELVETKMGALNTIHIARENDDHDEKTDVWLATDYQHLPVKIRKTEKNGKVYELLATKILTKAN